MKTQNPNNGFEDESPLLQEGETTEERALIAMLKILVAIDELSEVEIARVWKFVSRL